MIRDDATATTTTPATDAVLQFTSLTEPEPPARCLRVLDCLESLSGTATVGRLADELLSLDESSVSDAETARIRLHHSDLPRLENAGHLSYDSTRKRARLRR
ncbi:DUF7344 domain-containing protein [Natronorubrum sp. FCH18a]|uniref:DUF7344 domain-containing protein n=1 Tax=Natronorubrum sp. FCH18a TaxID=3447018 RepID=UPI003F518130